MFHIFHRLKTNMDTLSLNSLSVKRVEATYFDLHQLKSAIWLLVKLKRTMFRISNNLLQIEMSDHCVFLHGKSI